MKKIGKWKINGIGNLIEPKSKLKLYVIILWSIFYLMLYFISTTAIINFYKNYYFQITFYYFSKSFKPSIYSLL